MSWLTFGSPYSADIQDMNLSSREVLCRQSWRQWWSFRQCKCSCTIMLKVWPGCFDDLFSNWNVSYGCHFHVFSARFLLCSTLVLATLPHLHNVVDLDYAVQLSFLCRSLHFQVGFRFHHIQCWIIGCQHPVIGSSRLPYNDLFTQGLAWGIYLAPAENISRAAKGGLHCDTMLHDRE